MKSHSQAKLSQHPAKSVSSTTSAASKGPTTRDWVDRVHQEQIFEILNNDMPSKKNFAGQESDQPGKYESMFSQFKENQKAKKLPPRMSSQGSSRSNAQNPSFIMNKTGQQSIVYTEQHFSPQSSNSRDFGTHHQNPHRDHKVQQVRASTQEAASKFTCLNLTGRRSLRQPALSQNELPDLGSKLKAQNSFLGGKQHNMHSPSEKLIPTAIKQKKRILGGDGSSTDRLFNQIIQQPREERQEQNKENINDDSISNQTTSTKNYQHQAKLPMKLQRSFTHHQDSDSLSNRTSGSILPQNLSSQHLDKHMKEVSKQRELLLKLQREKEELEKQMQNNEKMIQNRMQKLHQERKQMEEKIVKACVTIQKIARGFIARLQYKKLVENHIQEEKQKLNNVLNELNNQIKTCFNNVEDQLDIAAVKIQNAARRMIARKNFRISLYKMMLLKNIIENKVHKEKMQMLYAFEQMIINTEDEEDEDYYDEMYGAEDYPAADYPGVGAGLGYRQFPQRVPLEAEYLSNPSDIIDEEECEDSEEEKEYELRQKQQSQEASRNNPSQNKILDKVTADDLLEFAGQSRSDPIYAYGNSTQTKEQFEIDGGCEIFGNTKKITFNDTQNSIDEKNYIVAVRNESQPKPQNSFQRRVQPRQQLQPKQKVLALPPPEPVKQPINRPLDMERIIQLSQPKTQPEDEPVVVKKKASKPPVVPGQKLKKKKTKKEGATDTNQPKKRPRRRSSNKGQGNFMDRYERLLKHRESRTSLRKENDKASQDKVFAIEYKPVHEQDQKVSTKLPQVLVSKNQPPQRQVIPPKSQEPSQRIQMNHAIEKLSQFEKQDPLLQQIHQKQVTQQQQYIVPNIQETVNIPRHQSETPQSLQLQPTPDQQFTAEAQPPQQSQDPSLLYKKCFPNVSMGFKDRFPVFADILQRYNKNLKHIAAAASTAQPKK